MMNQWNTRELKWVLVDLDDTLALTKKAEVPLLDARPNYPFVTKLKKTCKKRGFKLIVYTARHWDDVTIIESWMRKHHIPYKEIICGKPLARYIIDDKNLRPEEVDLIE